MVVDGKNHKIHTQKTHSGGHGAPFSAEALTGERKIYYDAYI
jgi:hypothetical protein